MADPLPPRIMSMSSFLEAGNVILFRKMVLADVIIMEDLETRSSWIV